MFVGDDDNPGQVREHGLRLSMNRNEYFQRGSLVLSHTQRNI